MTKTTLLWISALALAVLALAAPSAAEESKLDIGLRFDIGLGNGEPTNDIIGYSLFGHYRVNERWNLGFAADYSPEFDFERTPDLLRLTTPEVIDAKGTSITISGWIERVYRRPGGRYEWFWSAGLGFNSVDVEDISGPLEDGGTFDIRTDAGSEFQAMLGVGARRWFGESWGLEAAVHIDQHFADWKVTDRVSGATGTISDYTVNTINLGFLKKF